MTCIFLAAKNVEFVPYRNLLKTMMSRIYASPVPKVCGRRAKSICGLLAFASAWQAHVPRVLPRGSLLLALIWEMAHQHLGFGVGNSAAMSVVNLLRKCGRPGHILGCGPELLGSVLQEWVSELELECLDALEWRLGPFFRHTV